MFSESEHDIAYTAVTESEGEVRRRYSPPRPEIIVKTVCENCNSGWMANLEGQIRPLLGSLVRGESAHLDHAAQHMLARWGAKTAILLEIYMKDTIVLGKTDLAEIENGSAPIGYIVRMATYTGQDVRPFHFLGSSALTAPTSTGQLAEDEPNSFAITLVIGHLVFAVLGGPGVCDTDRWARPASFGDSIWPPASTQLTWPDGVRGLSSRSDVSDFHESFWVRIRNADFPRPDALLEEKIANDACA